MRILSFLIVISSLFSVSRISQSPHGANFKISCGKCHSTKSWELDKSVYSFDHNSTKMPLAGQHAVIDCRQCHISLVFSEASTRCNDCHTDIHQGTVGFDCLRCHNEVSWLVYNINGIHEMSRFPLVGAHRTADCSRCHISESLLRFDVQGVNCIDCHRPDYMATTNPNHIQSGISEDCAACHSVNSFQWTNAGFDHSIFPLVLGHSNVKCTDCHKSGTYISTPSDCYSCHQSNYLSAKNPDHAAGQFSTNCQECHSLDPGWSPAAFNHTGFPLTLGHSSLSCNDCHKGNYSSISPDCYSCHQQNYLATTNPNHAASGIPTSCQTCHTTNPGWQPASFDHGSFPLTLGHATPVCNDCHKGNYSSTSPDCYSCHQQNYQATTNPNHAASGIPTSCQNCHTTNPGWQPASFDHGSFPLTLGHATPACNDCHKGNYTSTSTDCFSCHQTDYNKTTNPNHQTIGFSTVCSLCHTTNPGWTPATYTAHDTQFFPIYSGRHQGQWSQCTDCHTNASDYALFDCIHCHTNAHSGSNYTNAQCYSCHPRGTSE